MTMAIVVKKWLPILAIVRKDIGLWLRQPTAITATILPAVAFMIILYFGAQAVGRNPVALVLKDNGPHAHELVNILNESDAFNVSITSEQQVAERALQHIQVGAVITIPSNFDTLYNTHKAYSVIIHINNLNLDFTNDLRRSLPAAITQLYSENQNQSNSNHNSAIKSMSRRLTYEDMISICLGLT